MDTRADRVALFGCLADPDTASDFFARVADDVSWTVEGTHPLAGTYTSKAAFTAATFDRLTPLMTDGVKLALQHLYVDGDTVIAELGATSTTLEGASFDNHYCWVCRFADDQVGAEIVEVRAYLDSAMVAWTVSRNES
jgi:ketosteroid isomerase-like protein